MHLLFASDTWGSTSSRQIGTCQHLVRLDCATGTLAVNEGRWRLNEPSSLISTVFLFTTEFKDRGMKITLVFFYP